MIFKPRHNDKGLRATYIILLFLSVLFLMIDNPQYKWLYLSLAIVTLIGGVYLIISFELTSYSYVFQEKGKRVEFFVDKATGKRNNYVCYYHLSDLCYFGKQDEKTKQWLDEKYKGAVMYRYVHNIFTKEKYIMVFKGERGFEAIIIEANAKLIAYMEKLTKAYELKLDKAEEQ